MPLSPHSARSSSSIGRHPDRAGNWTRTPFLYLYISPPLSRCPPWLCSSVGALGPANSWWQDSGCLSWRSRLHHPFLDSKATLGEGWGVCRVCVGWVSFCFLQVLVKVQRKEKSRRSLSHRPGYVKLSVNHNYASSFCICTYYLCHWSKHLPPHYRWFGATTTVYQTICVY